MDTVLRVVAGTRSMAERWARQHLLCPKNWRYANLPEHVRGLYKDQIFVVRPVQLIMDSALTARRKEEILAIYEGAPERTGRKVLVFRGMKED